MRNDVTYQDFRGRDFAAGSVFGVRAFAVDPSSHLAAAAWPYTWTPGENLAQCFQPILERLSLLELAVSKRLQKFATRPVAGGVEVRVYLPLAAEDEEPAAHHTAVSWCRCGFYAYTDVEHAEDYHHSAFPGATVQGIVEGYGTVTIGSKGFRASKARIVALVIEPQATSWPAVWKVPELYPDIPIYTTLEEALAAHPLGERSAELEAPADGASS